MTPLKSISVMIVPTLLMLWSGARAARPIVLSIPKTPYSWDGNYSSVTISQVRNPFVWPERPHGPSPSQIKRGQHVLQAILWNSSRPLAVIDGRLVGEGEAVGDALVVSIHEKGVILKHADGATTTLQVKDEFLEVFSP